MHYLYFFGATSPQPFTFIYTHRHCYLPLHSSINQAASKSLPSKMVSANFLGVFLLMELLAGGFRFGADGLSMNYYIFNCPFVEPIVRSTVASALQSDPTLAAALVRMHFHDCWIQVLRSFLSLHSHYINLPFRVCDCWNNLKYIGMWRVYPTGHDKG